MKTSFKIIAALIAVLSFSTVAVVDASAKSHHKKNYVSKAKKTHKSKNTAKKNHVQKNTKKESPKAEAAKPVENHTGGEMKTRLIDNHQ